MKKLLLPLLVLAATVGRGPADEPARDGGKGTYQTEPVKRGSVAAVVRATGTLEPEEVVDVGARVSGTVAQLGADPNDPKKPIGYGTLVEKDTVLARLDPTLYEARAALARANLERARADLALSEARLKLAERDLQRARALLERKGISQEEYDAVQGAFETARASVAVSKAAVAQAEAALREAELNVAYTIIKSPIKGVIVDRRVGVGQRIEPSPTSASLFLIGTDLKRLTIWASVNEADIAQIKKGQPVTFTVEAFPGETFTGVVRLIRLNAAMTQNVVTYTVEVAVENPQGKLLPYLTAEVRFEVGKRENVLLVPNAALRWRPRPEQLTPDARAALTRLKQDQALVWVEDKGQVRPVPVQTGLSDGRVTEVVKGDLTEGSAVVTGVRDEPGEKPKPDRPLKEGDVLLIQPGAPFGGAQVGAMVRPLTAEDAAALARECPAVRAAAPVVRARTQVSYGARSWVPLYIYGSTPAFLEARAWPGLAEGKTFTERDVRNRAKVCLVGQTLVDELFHGKSPIGKKIRIANVPFEVIGVLNRKGANRMGLDQDDLVLAPWTTIRWDVRRTAVGSETGEEKPPPPRDPRYPGTLASLYPNPSSAALADTPAANPSAVDQIVVRAQSREAVARARGQITELLRKRHCIAEGAPDDFNIRD